MANDSLAFSTVDSRIWDYSLLEIFTLHRIHLSPVPLVRYQILKDIQNYFVDVSTGKIYRMLKKFKDHQLVKEVDQTEQAYEITEKGITVIHDSQELVNQFGLNVLAYFKKFVPDVLRILDTPSGKVLLYDFEQIYETAFMELLANNTGQLYLLSEVEQFNFYQQKVPELKRSPLEGGIIREPERYFDTIVCVFHDDVQSMMDEFFRVLKPGGYLIINQTDATDTHHFIHTILFQQFAPEFLKKKKKLLSKDKINTDKWKLIEKMDLEGLMLLKLEKIK